MAKNTCLAIPLLVIIIMILFYHKLQINKSRNQIIIVRAIHTDLTDPAGKHIKGTGLTPLTTPAMRSCPQLKLAGTQECSNF
jgi:hypothetical protein